MVDRVDPEGTFGFIVGPNDEEYFFHMRTLRLLRDQLLEAGVLLFQRPQSRRFLDLDAPSTGPSS